MGKPLDIALVGCGRAAERLHLPAIAACEEVRLVALVDTDRTRLSAAAAKAAVEGRAPQQLGSAGDLAGVAEAAIVATPPATHPEVTRTLAGAGVRCLVEKPPAADREGAVALAALAPAPAIGFNRRFAWPGIAGGLARLEPGFRIEAAIDGNLGAWAAFEEGGDALAELGCHLADLAMIALEDGVEARCGELSATAARFSLASSRGEAVLRCDAASSWREHLVIRDRSGRPVGRWRAGGIAGRLAARLGRSLLVEASTRQLRAFARGDCDSGEPASAGDGVRTMAALDAVRASAAAGGPAIEVAAP